jgi:hypothetical protein
MCCELAVVGCESMLVWRLQVLGVVLVWFCCNGFRPVFH